MKQCETELTYTLALTLSHTAPSKVHQWAHPDPHQAQAKHLASLPPQALALALARE
jgi:hypothetical protein